MAALGDYGKASRQYLDFSGERQSITFHAIPVTAVNLAAYLGDLSDLEDALDAVTLGTAARSEFGNFTVISNTRPGDPMAQVETELLVRMVGATSEAPWSFRIPTADYTKFNYGSGDDVILSGAGASPETVALIDALEAFVRNPNDSAELMTVVGISVVE